VAAHETSGAHLARLRVRFSNWRIERSATGSGYTAYNRDEHAAPNMVYAPDLPSLEAALHETAPGNGTAQH
jgi:hypothetical protein